MTPITTVERQIVVEEDYDTITTLLKNQFDFIELTETVRNDKKQFANQGDWYKRTITLSKKSIVELHKYHPYDYYLWTGWVSIKRYMPNVEMEKCSLLVRISQGENNIIVYPAIFKNGFFYTLDFTLQHQNVTHWAYIPH